MRYMVGYMANMKQTAFRLDEVDFRILDEVQQLLGASSRTDALRFILRSYARECGLAGLEPGANVSSKWLLGGMKGVQARKAASGAPAPAKPTKARKRT